MSDLEGLQIVDSRDVEINQLRASIRRLQRDLDDANKATDRAREDTQRALSMLRSQLSPLYRALQAVFGEIDAAGVDEAPTQSTPGEGPFSELPPRVLAVWQSWKEKMPGRPAQFIDILLQHKEATAAQFRIAARCGSTTVTNTIYLLNKAGLINKNGGKISLKAL